MLLTERIRSIAESLNMTFASIERDVGLGRGTIRKWDTNSPACDKLLRVANLLHTSVDFLLTGNDMNHTLSAEEEEWLYLISKLPIEKRYEFKGEIKGYLRYSEGESVAANTPKRTGTDNLGK